LLFAKETLTATILHELSQPLAAAAKQIARLRHIAETAGDSIDVESVLRGLDVVDEMIGRCILIISRIRALAIDERPVRSQATIEALIRNAVRTIEGTSIMARVRLDIDARVEETVTCDPAQIEQVIANLLLNAAAAARDQSTPTVSIRVATRRSLEHGRQLEIIVFDNGPGVVPEELQDLVRTSLHDTHGIGLAICRSLVELHGGQLWHARSPAGGAAFHFTLPMTPPREA
jgi:signal transduction histidine kinase